MPVLVKRSVTRTPKRVSIACNTTIVGLHAPSRGARRSRHSEKIAIDHYSVYTLYCSSTQQRLQKRHRMSGVSDAATQRYASAHASFGGTDEFGEWNIEFSGDRQQRHDSRVVCPALESANDVSVEPGAVRQRFLAQRLGVAAVADFLAQCFENVFGRHSRHVWC